MIYDPSSLKEIGSITEVIDPDKETLTLIKFNPNSDLLAVCYTPPTSSIVFYSTRNWKKTTECKDLPARVMCLDFSTDGKFCVVSLANNDIKYIDVNNS